MFEDRSEADKKRAKGALVLIVLLILVGAAASPFLVWTLTPPRDLSVWVVDKSVAFPDMREHSSIYWILRNARIVKPSSLEDYSATTDYFGIRRVGGGYEPAPLPSDGSLPDLLYIADTYGIDSFNSPDFTGPLKGGLSPELNSSILSTLRKGVTLIAEYDVAGLPTQPGERDVIGSALGIQWTGWTGKYYPDLMAPGAVPDKVKQNYENLRKAPWLFFSGGFVVISESGDVQVLLDDVDVGSGRLSIGFDPEWGRKLGVRGNPVFNEWFEWVIPQVELETVAEFSLDLSPAGRRKLEALGLPGRFPAVLRNPTTQYLSWYFAGDFAHRIPDRRPASVAGLRGFRKLVQRDAKTGNESFHWKVYVPMMRAILDGIVHDKYGIGVPARAAARTGTAPEVKVRASGRGFTVLGSDGVWKEFFIRGVNMGMAEPGKFFTNFPESVDTYRRWLDSIADMNTNTIRVYTLLPPAFYHAFRAYNIANPAKPLLLLQEIWPEENPEDGDYLAEAYHQAYLREINYGVDAIYGMANVPRRTGRSWGVYTVDVSPWLLGWLVGRELESEEVMETDHLNKGVTYTGDYISAGPQASPTEVWLAESLDEVVSIETERYGKQHPVALVSWPTLDPVSHDSEWNPLTGKTRMGNDRAVVDISHLDITPAMQAGLFGAYHIYPNYPDFINNEPSYDGYRDGEGVLRYGGYLREFMGGHGKYPALVAEFGLATGAGIAHFAPDGMHHGGIGEAEQGTGTLRMLRAMRDLGYAGGIIFEWMDEWVKKTWTTEPFMIPYERNVLWHNVTDPEQNYGLMANEVIPPEKLQRVATGSGRIRSVSAGADAAWLHVDIVLSGPIDLRGEEILLGIDTYGRTRGQMRWPESGRFAPSGMEFLVRITDPGLAQLLVVPGYNTNKYSFSSPKLTDGTFERMLTLVNGERNTRDGRYIPPLSFDSSAMYAGEFDEAMHLWKMEGDTIRIRIPWTRLNVTDPSSLQVLDDPRTAIYNLERDQLKTSKTDGFVLHALSRTKSDRSETGHAEQDPSAPYLWQGWETPPPYRERFKKSYHIIKKAWADSGEG